MYNGIIKKRNINCAKVKEKYVGIRNHLFSYTYILILQILNKIFEINLAPSINSCSLEPNPRDNSALQQLWIFVVLNAPTNDFSSRLFLSHFHPRQDASASFSCSFFISSLRALFSRLSLPPRSVCPLNRSSL